MIPFGWERRLELEYSDSLKVFGASSVIAEKFADETFDRFSRSLGNEDLEGVRAIVLDLRNAEFDCPSMKLAIGKLEKTLLLRNVQLCCISNGRECGLFENSLPCFRSENELYGWLVENSFTRFKSSAAPLFSFTEQEVDDIRRNGVVLSDFIEELEGLGEKVS